MAKVSKNLRRLRTDCGMTQAQLADQMHVTRQAISNWENDKTQPDIDALVQLSEILGTEIEALIYGKRRHVGTDEQRPDYRIRIVLAVLGTLFVGIGLVLIFFNFWRDFPMGLQAVFSVLPILLGQGFAVYVFLRQRQSVLFRECAAILWCVGVVSTVALVNSVFDIHCGFTNCLLLDIVFCLPVLWLFQAVSPLAPYLGMVVLLSALVNGIKLIPALLLLIGGLLLPLVLRRDKTDTRYKFSVWIATLGAVTFYAMQIAMRVGSQAAGSDGLLLIPVFLIPIFACLLLWDFDMDFTKPFAPLGLFGVTACNLFISIIAWSAAFRIPLLSDRSQMFSHLAQAEGYIPQFPAISDQPALYIAILLSILVAVGCVLLRRKELEDDILQILLFAFSGGTFLFALFGSAFSAENLYLFVIPCIVGFGVVLLLIGASWMRMTFVNLGMIVLFLQCVLLLERFQVHILLVGIAFLAFGALLIGINVKMARDKQELLTAETQNAVENETEAEQ